MLEAELSQESVVIDNKGEETKESKQVHKGICQGHKWVHVLPMSQFVPNNSYNLIDTPILFFMLL